MKIANCHIMNEAQLTPGPPDPQPGYQPWRRPPLSMLRLMWPRSRWEQFSKITLLAIAHWRSLVLRRVLLTFGLRR